MNTYKPYQPYKPPIETVPAPTRHHSTAYMRGFIGMTNQDIDHFTNSQIQAGGFSIVHHDFDSSPLVGLGLGVHLGSRFRVDVTGEYRGASDFRGLDIFRNPGPCPGVCTNEHTGTKEEWLFLFNSYWDLGTIRGITPYVGAGIGAAAVTLDNFWDVNQVTNGLAFAESNTEWNFAWALHAGLAYDLSDKLKLDFAYRYVETGDGVTGTFDAFDSSFIGDPPTTLKDIHSHDVMVGLRWNFGEEEAPVAYK